MKRSDILEQKSVQELKKIANEVRIGIIEAVYNASSGHPRRITILCRYFNCTIF
jgi:transketolase N-terminal domain/subunit